MNVRILKKDKFLVLEYKPDYGEQFFETLKTRYETYTFDGVRKGYDIKNTFYVDYDNFLTSQKILGNSISKDWEDVFYFVIGDLKDGFYKLDKKILGLNFDLFFEEKIKQDIYFYVKYESVSYSVFRAFNNFYKRDKLYILNEKIEEDIFDDSISLERLERCIELIPMSTEMKKYRESRYTKALIDYLNVDDKENELKDYVNKKYKLQLKNQNSRDKIFAQIDKEKYQNYLDKLKIMLSMKVDERDWQTEILKIFRLINPKYIYIGEKIQLKSFVTGENLFSDIVLVDCDGNIDLLEIKIPDKDLFYKTDYRGNNVPIKELTGTCMQLQNYLISLTKTSDEELNKSKFKKDYNIPDYITLKSTSSKGYILYGRNEQLKDEKRWADFQILRNMYSNIIDIITYDDLIVRLENIIKSFN